MEEFTDLDESQQCDHLRDTIKGVKISLMETDKGKGSTSIRESPATTGEQYAIIIDGKTAAKWFAEHDNKMNDDAKEYCTDCEVAVAPCRLQLYTPSFNGTIEELAKNKQLERFAKEKYTIRLQTCTNHTSSDKENNNSHNIEILDQTADGATAASSSIPQTTAEDPNIIYTTAEDATQFGNLDEKLREIFCKTIGRCDAATSEVILSQASQKSFIKQAIEGTMW